MAAEMTLGGFVNRLQGVYQSIDIRIAAAKSGDMWQNVLTVVRFSYKEPQDLQMQQKEIERRWMKVQTSNFRIDMQAWSFENLDTLCNQFFNEGKLLLLGESQDIQLGRSVDLLSLKGRFERYGHTRREVSSWPCFEASTGEYYHKIDNPQLQSEVKSNTLLDVFSLISELLEVDFHKDLGLDLIVNAPFYAIIENTDFGEKKCKARIKFHKDIEALAFSTIARRGDSYNSPIRDKASSLIKLEEAEELDEQMRLWTKEFDLPNAAPTDYLWASLIQTAPSALDIEKQSYPTQISKLLEGKKPAKAPLVSAFSRFCTLDELEEYLTKPTQTVLLKADRGPSATFELGIAWLLGLCGFNIVWLGQTEREVLKENKVTRFSADMLASHHESEDLLFLIGCTIGSPNDKDVDSLKSIRSILQDEIFKGTKLHIKPIIFSAAPELSNKERDGIKILDAGDMRGMLNLLRQSERKRALNEYLGHDLGFMM